MTSTRILFSLLIAGSFVACNTNHTSTTENTAVENTEAVEPTPVTKDTTSSICGIDISKYQGDEIDCLNKNQVQLTFVICKATEGITYTDPDFKNNWRLTQQKGFVRGCYHFYHCTDDPTAQANNYLSAIGTLSENDFPPIVDFEEASIDKGCNKSTIQKNLLQFLVILQQKTGRMPLLYTDLNTGNNQLTDTAFAKYCLWIADYNKAATPGVPATWKNKNWTFWQKSDKYTGADSLIADDFDIFNGNQTEFFKFMGRS